MISGHSDAPARTFRLSFRRVLVELPLGAAVAAATSLALQLPIARLGLSEPTQLPEVAAAASAACLLTVLFAALLLLRGGLRDLKIGCVWVALSALNTLVLAWPLEPTRLYYGGASADQAFRLQYLTRLTESPELADMNYVGLPPFYPAAWFWLGGRFANLTGMPAWAAYKPYALLTVAVTGVVAFTLWSVVVRRRTAVLLGVATGIAGFLQGVEEPYAWMSAAWLPPVALVAWHALRCRHRAATIGVGLFLGFTAVTYTLYFGFAAMVLCMMAAVAVLWSRPRAGIGAVALRLIAIGGVGCMVALLAWTPFLRAVLVGEPSHAMANRYLPEDSVLPFPMLQLTLFGVLCLIGFAWLILAVHRSEVAQGLLVVVASVYSWFALSTVAIAAQTTLLAFRLSATLNVVLAAAGVLGLLDLWRWARVKVDSRHLVQATALVFLLGLAGSLATIQDALHTSLAKASQPAYDDYYPTGTNSQRLSDPGRPGAWHDEMAAAISETTRRSPNEVVLLSAYSGIMSFHPYWGFQQETPHYANPLARFDERAAEVRKWATAGSSQELLAMLDRGPFVEPNAFLLRRADDGLHVTLSYDAFPHHPNVQVYEVVFPESLFDSPEFVRRDVGPFTVIARTR